MRKTSILRHVDMLVDASMDNSEGYYLRLLSQHGVHRASYLAFNLPKASGHKHFLYTSYPDSWSHHYLDRKYLSIDPVISRSLAALLPYDWADFQSMTPMQTRMFGEFREFGLGQQGLSIPLRSRGDEIGVMSLTSELSAREWKNFKQEKLAEISLLASLCNASVMKELTQQTTPPNHVLTKREVECLRWCAEGKTFDEIAGILGISPRTVRFFLDNARRKLNCLNIVQTVVTALQRHLI